MLNRSSLRPSLALSVGALLLPHHAAAQTLEIAPVTIDLPAGRETSIIRITNRGDQSTTIQMRPFSWSQQNSEDTLLPTADLVLSPPFSTLEPGDTQTVRIVLRKPPVLRESAYRLLIDQLPAAANPGTVRVTLRISLPVFAAAAGLARATLTWKIVGDDPVKRSLVVRNEGSRRAKISELKISGSATAPGYTFRYVLAGSEISIPVDAGSLGWAAFKGRAHISGSTDQGRFEADAPITPAP